MMARRFAVSAAGRFGAAALQALVLALIARSFSLGLFGSYILIASLTQLVFAVVDLGFGSRVLQLGTDSASRRLLGTAMVLRGLATAAVLIAVAAAVLARQEPSDLVLVAIATSVYVSGEAVGDLAVGLLQNELRSGSASIALIARRAIACIPFLAGTSVLTAALGLIAAGLLGHALFWTLAARRAAAPLGLRRMLVMNRPFILTTLGLNAQQADGAIVAAGGGTALAAFYGAAARLANPLNLAVSTLIQVLTPELRRLEGEARVRAFRRARVVVLGAATLIICGSVASPQILTLVFGPRYEAAAPVLACVFVAAAVSGVSQIHLTWLYVTRARGYRGSVVIVVTLVGLLGVWIGSMTLGQLGCGLALIATQLALLAYFLRVYRRAVSTGAGAPS